MASAMNHRKRSHRSDKWHRQCLMSMKQFVPANSLGALYDLPHAADRPEKKMGPRKLLSGNMVSKHIGGWLKSTKKRNRKRANSAAEVAA